MARKNTHATIRLKPTEKSLYQSLATDNDLTLSEWIRLACREKANGLSTSQELEIYERYRGLV